MSTDSVECHICHQADALANLKRTTDAANRSGSAHLHCIEKHNKKVRANERASEAWSVAQLMRDCDLDACSSYAVENFLRDGRHKEIGISRRPKADDVVTAACKLREQRYAEGVFETLEEKVEASFWPAEIDGVVLAEIASDLAEGVPPLEAEPAATRLMIN